MLCAHVRELGLVFEALLSFGIIQPGEELGGRDAVDLADLEVVEFWIEVGAEELVAYFGRVQGGGERCVCRGRVFCLMGVERGWRGGVLAVGGWCGRRKMVRRVGHGNGGRERKIRYGETEGPGGG